ncbi:MAG: polysaccharide deacetylase family protein, partial [Tepidanaerobacteraceae bacterium]
MPFSLQHKSLLSKLLLLTLILSAVTLALPLSMFASEIINDDKQPKIKVLCYHHIIPETLSKRIDTVVSVSEFEEQMKYLYQHGYYTASVKDIQEFLYSKKKLPENTLLITFDDGYESNYIYAYPILKKYGFRAVIFPIGSGITESEQPEHTGTLTKLSYR